MIRFRFKQAIPCDYNTQGYIYFLCINYDKLPADMKKLIRETAKLAGGEYHKAVMDFMTTGHGAVDVCTRHYISEVTLWRAIKKFYIEFEKTL